MSSKGRLEYEADGESPVMRNAGDISFMPAGSIMRRRTLVAATRRTRGVCPRTQEADRRDGEVIALDSYERVVDTFV